MSSNVDSKAYIVGTGDYFKFDLILHLYVIDIKYYSQSKQKRQFRII